MNTENTERHSALVEAIGLANGETAASPTAPDAPKDPPADAPADEHAQANAEAPEGDEDEDESAPSDGNEPPKPRRNRLQERFDKVTREKYELAARVEAAEARERAREEQERKAAEGSPEPPTLEQFGYDTEAHQAALIKWARADGIRQHNELVRRQAAERAAVEQAAKVNERIEALEKESPGAWDRVTSAPINYTPHMVQALKESEFGPKIGLYLADHLDEAHRITRLSPVAQVVAIGRIEAQLSMPAPAAAAPPTPPRKTVTNAPPPPPALAAASKVATPIEQQSIEDRMKAIREFEANR